MRHFSISSRRRGLTLSESAIVLGITGIVLGAIWTAGAMVYKNMQVSESIGHLMTLSQNIRTFYGGQNEFKGTGDYTDKMLEAKVFPPPLLDSNGNPKTPWGTDITVTVPAGKRTFTVDYGDDLPVDICRNLAGRVAGKGRDQGLVAVEAGTTNHNDSDKLNNLSPTSVGDCESVSFTFKLK